MNYEEAWKQFVDGYDIAVPDDKVRDELHYIELEMRHRMNYDTLTGGKFHMFPSQELKEHEAEYLELARFEAKSELVMQKLLSESDIVITPEELKAEAEALAARENTSIDMVKRFFGDDFAGLERDVKERRIKEAVLHRERISNLDTSR